MLQVERLSAGYGLAPVLRGVSFTVEPGRIVSLLGRNGSGRTTTLKAVAGLVAAQGAVAWRGGSLLGLPPFAIARRGVGYVAESRDVFPTLSVEQNLLLGEKPGRPRQAGPWNTAEVYRLFPRLHDCRKRPAGVLSGGEQQMLAIGRCLMGNPELLLIDEPTEGLAPQLVELVAATLLQLRERGVAVLLVEQKLAIALQISDRCCVLGGGRIVFDGTPDELRAAADIRQGWLAV